MSAEPRRIKKVVRRYNNPLLTPEELQEAHRRADGVKKTSPGAGSEPFKSRYARAEKTLAYTLTKARVIEGCVTLPQLAAERGIQAQLARLWVKAAGIKKPGDRWVWRDDSKALARVRKALGLKP